MGVVDNEFTHDVIVVGAGAAGIGVSVALKHAGIDRFVVLERHRIGASFAKWPSETRFITPSFPTNAIGFLDLNSVAIGVSPAYSLGIEHPTGADYARHLRTVAEFFDVPFWEQVDVTEVVSEFGGFRVETSEATLSAPHIIWAAGEFQYPRLDGFPGAELCRHTATIESYEDLDGDDIIVIGGYESGVDAAYHLAYHDKLVRLFDSGCPWESTSSDPSIALAPFTLERMHEDWFREQVALFPHTSIIAVEAVATGFEVIATDGSTFHSDVPPLWAGGFAGSHGLISDLFERRRDGFPLLTRNDESTIAPGLFFCGPAVRHEDHIFCFIYKYRQRFAVVAKAIATALGLPAESLETYRAWGMYLDDLSVCGEDCVC